MKDMKKYKVEIVWHESFIVEVEAAEDEVNAKIQAVKHVDAYRKNATEDGNVKATTSHIDADVIRDMRDFMEDLATFPIEEQVMRVAELAKHNPRAIQDPLMTNWIVAHSAAIMKAITPWQTKLN